MTHYFIQLTIAKDARSFSGHQTVSYTNRSPDPQDVLYFRLYPNGGHTYGNGHLQVDQVQVAGQPVVPGLPVDPTILEVRLAEPLPPGESIQTELDFSGAVPVDFASDPGRSAYGIFNTSDDILTLANFYPILAAQDAGGWRLDPVYPVSDGGIAVLPAGSFIDNLDAVPYPAGDLLDPDSYRIGKKRATMIITSWGCTHRCAYCSAHRTMGTTFRTRSPMNIIEEMKECRARYDIQAFDLEDDNFTYDQKRAAEVLRLIIETFGEGRLEMSAMNGISYASLSGELMGLMKRAGFSTINISLVSTSDSLRSAMGRPESAADFSAVLDVAERAGLNVIAYAILGMPGQTIRDMVDTVGYLISRRVLIGPSIYYPVPGTVLFGRCTR